jgi:glycosyltransferase involved in cell wall biosynthesis
VTNKRVQVALVHDWLVSPGGAERTVLTMHEIWPDAPLYTSAYAPEKFAEFKGLEVRTTWLDKISLAKRKQQLFSIPRALAFKMLDLSEFDMVVSSSSAESKYVRTGRESLHFCYCHTPIRYYWSDYEWYRQHPPFGPWLNPVAAVVLPLLIPFLRRMDYQAAQRVNFFIANSKNVQARIRKYYNRDSTVIYPPVNTDRFRAATGSGEYYLVFGRQVAYKRLDLAIDAFNKLGLPLVVAGSGEEMAKQQARAKSNINFLGRVPDNDLPELYSRAIALVFPAEEDFGIVPVEAMACGRPVIAYGKGGALESVVDGQTGVFFKDQSAQALVEAVERFRNMNFDTAAIRRRAEQFSAERFKREMKKFVEQNMSALRQ